MPANIWAICSKKGGPGKTTTAANLAVELQKKGHVVKVIDADKQGTLSRYIDRRNERTDTPSMSCSQKTGQINILANDLAEHSDYVIIDTAGRESAELRYALMVADLIIIPNRPSYIDLEELDPMEEELALTEPLAKPTRKVIAFLNACDTKKIQAKREARALVNEYSSIPLANQQIPNSQQFGFTMRDGLVISEQKQERGIAGSYQILLDELLNYEQGN